MKSAYIEVIMIAKDMNQAGKVNRESAEAAIKQADNNEHELLVQALIKIADLIAGH